MSDKLRKILWLVALALIVVAGVSLWSKPSAKAPALTTPDQSTYQAVILKNDRLFFGKLSKLDTEWPTLSDVYYLREKAQEAEITRREESTPQAQPKFELIKVGSEIHRPQDTMVFNRDSVLYWSNLKSDSNVIKLIEQSKAQK